MTAVAAARTPLARARALLADLGPGECVAVGGMGWAEYLALLADRDATRRGVRVHYSRGLVEIMPTSNLHELWKELLSLLLAAYVEEHDLPFVPGGQMSLWSETDGRGADPDASYYVSSAAAVFPPRLLDAGSDPPPDLVVEIEYTRTVIDRLPLYAGMGVAEVWRFNGTALTVLSLGADGEYAPVPESLVLPGLPLAEFAEHLLLWQTVRVMDIVRRYRALVRNRLAGGSP